jgi:DNA-binding response OmpR family regulator
MERLRVLAIDDEPALLRIIKDSLNETYEVSIAESAKDAFALMLDRKPHLILVDNIMPGINGVDFIKTIRSAEVTKNIPIIMLTALKESDDRMEAYKAGVDDFISKPFSPDELLIRVQSRIERSNQLGNPNSSTKTLGNLTYEFKNRDLRINGYAVHLTQIELTIIEKLITDINQIVKRETFQRLIWGDNPPEARILDIHMATLRKKLKSFNYKIETIYGKGYTLRNVKQ